MYLYISEAVAEKSSSSHKGQKEQSCQEKGCAFALLEGENFVCCQVPANQLLLNVTGLNRRKGYSVTVSGSNGAGEGEESNPIILPCEFCGAMYTTHLYEGEIMTYFLFL